MQTKFSFSFFVRFLTFTCILTAATTNIAHAQAHIPLVEQTKTGVTLLVNTANDELNNDGDCSLREAIQAANLDQAVDGCPAGNGTDTIVVPAGFYPLTLIGAGEDQNATGDLDIGSDLNLIGAGAGQTILDGNQSDRVLHLHAQYHATVSQLTIQQGRTLNGATPTSGLGGASEGGGGILNDGHLILTQSIITQNRTGDGGNSTDEQGGNAGHGGAVANIGVMTLTASSVLSNSTGSGGYSHSADYDGGDAGVGGGLYNAGRLTIGQSEILQNWGGNGGDTAGFANQGFGGHGGGIFNAANGHLTLHTSRIVQNYTGLGNAYVGPFGSGPHGAYGGGLYNRGTVVVEQSRIEANYTGGVNFEWGSGSGGLGGGIYNQGAMLVTASSIARNYTGNGSRGPKWGGGSGGDGGGIFNEGSLTLASASVYHNETGDGLLFFPNAISCSGDGGGIANTGTLTLTNSTVSANSTGRQQIAPTCLYSGEDSGNYGGGLFNYGGVATVINSTFSDNGATDKGGALYNNGSLSLRNTILVNSLQGGDCANEGTLAINRSNLVEDGRCAPMLRGEPWLGALAQNGAANGAPTHALLGISPAIDAGDPATCAALPINNLDQRGQPRPQGRACDIGAYERKPLPNDTFLVSLSTGGRVMDVGYADEDILFYDRVAQTWRLYFDGSDVGLGAVDVDAVELLPDGNLLLSLDQPLLLNGLDIDDSDILLFAPTKLGTRTTGSFHLYLDGSDVGLSDDGEDIDALARLPDGRLLISVLGRFATPTLTGPDEDLYLLTSTSLGENSAGVWSRYLDGSDIALTAASEDVWGAWHDPVNQGVHLTTMGAFSMTWNIIAGDGNDVLHCSQITPGNDTRCYNQFLADLGFAGLGEKIIDGYAVVNSLPLAPLVNSVEEAAAPIEALGEIVGANDDPTNGDMDATDSAEDEMLPRIYLPLIRDDTESQ